MINLQTLAGLLRDEELRQKLTRVTSAKIKADIKALQANAELSRRLVERTVRPGASGDAAEGEKVLRTIVSEHLDYYSTLIDLSAAFSDRLLAMLAAAKAADAGAAPAPVLAMNLKGPLGSTLRAPFEIENNRPDPITAIFRLTPYVSEDGSQLVAANHAFDPPQAAVPPRGKARIVFVQPITEGFAAGRDYLATISVEGLDAMQIVVRLHVEPAASAPEKPPQAGIEEPAPPASASAEPPAAAKPGRAPARRTAAKASAPKKAPAKKRPRRPPS